MADCVGGTLCVVGALSAVRGRAQGAGLAGAGHDGLLGVAHREVATGVGEARVLSRLVSQGGQCFTVQDRYQAPISKPTRSVSLKHFTL